MSRVARVGSRTLLAGPVAQGIAVAGWLVASGLLWSDRVRTRADGRSVQDRLAETDRIRNDLIGTVSHEFRTPLTGIRGAALTLQRHGDQLDEAARHRLLQAVLDSGERLSRLLENMLTASEAIHVDGAAVCDVDLVAAEVAEQAATARAPVALAVEPAVAKIEHQALRQVLANLVDNAQQHGAPDSTPLVAGGADEQGVWLAVSNQGATLDLDDAARLFQPFSQAESGPTREHEGLGMGLYVVRRLVEVHGGSLEVRSYDGWVTVEVRLQQAG